VPVVAEIHTGVLQMRLDRRSIAATASDTTWESGPGAASGDHYAVTVHSGTARVTLEEDRSIPSVSTPHAAPVVRAGLTDVLNVVLDGVAARLR
jgi:hypothetical protein